MKITEVTPVCVGAGMRNWIFVKVVTDGGLVGWGEATTEWRTRSVLGALEDIEALLLGEDPFAIEHIWQSLYRHQFWKGGIVVTSAASGVDQALHDIKAQALNVPLYELLGGRVRDRLRLYDHLGGGDPHLVYADLDPEAFADSARRSVEDGFTALKILPVPITGLLPEARNVRMSVAVLEAVRGAVGDDVDIMLDFHGRTTPTGAIEYGRALAPMRPWFIEEPCQPEDTAALAQIAARMPVPLATGERLVGRSAFLKVLETRAVAVVQPDVCHCGGLSEMRRIASIAEVFNVAVAPHNPAGPIATAHSLHFGTATPNWIIQEQMRNAVPWWDDILTAPLSWRDGDATLPAGPGLGVAVDEREARRHPYVPEAQPRATHPDGSVADW